MSTVTTTPSPATSTTRRLSGGDVRVWLQNNGVYAALVVLIVVNVAITPNFLTTANLRTQLIQASPVIVVALGMALVIGTEGIDLSVGAVMALAAAVIPLYIGYGPGLAIVVALLAGVVVGLINGSLVAFVRVQPIVATLALMVGGRGIALVLADGQLKQINNTDFLAIGRNSVGGVPIVVLIAAVLALIVGFLVNSTTFGRSLVAIGSNRRAAKLSGMRVNRVLVGVYVISGVLAAVAGILATSRLSASDPSSIGLLFELSAITAVVVGGTPLDGGRVRVLATVAGALLMQLIRATLIKNDVPDSQAQMIQAAIILLAVYFQLGRRSAR